MSQNKTKSITQMFDAIAVSYDRLNHLFTFNIDKRWRTKAVGMIRNSQRGEYMDLACGTGDMMLELLKRKQPTRLVGVDLSANMMEIGKTKVHPLAGNCTVEFRLENCESLSSLDNSFDAITIGFGIRNVQQPLLALKEMHRTLKPSGEVIVLELSRPENAIIRWGSDLYFHRIVPFFGRLLSKHPSAYSYLPKSVVHFPCGEAFLSLMREAGFTTSSRTTVLFGVATIYRGVK